ncbi:MAG: hypothetical protein ACREWI_00420 [Telluria sp.]
MKTSRFDTFTADMQDLGRKCNRAVRSSARSLAALPWPSLLVVSVVLACLLTVVPLALMLFVGFLLLKLLATALFGRRPPQLVE